MKWRILIQKKKSASYNMATDEAILLGNIEGTSLPTIRFYDWEVPTLSIGYNQKAKAEIDFEVMNKKGYDFVRRPTGGRMVLHKNEVTYAVITPLSDEMSGNVLASYSRISKALACGISKMGISIEFEKGRLSASSQREDLNPCFTSSSRYELKVGKRKIVGSAQVRKNHTLLQHGSILLDNNQSEVAHFLPLSDSQRLRMSQIIGRKTTYINESLNIPFSYMEAVQFLIAGFEDSWEDTFVYESLTPSEEKCIFELQKNKYSASKWNNKQ